MGSRKRTKSHKVYGVQAFANKSQLRRMRIRDGGCPPCKAGVFFEQYGEKVAAPKRVTKL